MIKDSAVFAIKAQSVSVSVWLYVACENEDETLNGGRMWMDDIGKDTNTTKLISSLISPT